MIDSLKLSLLINMSRTITTTKIATALEQQQQQSIAADIVAGTVLDVPYPERDDCKALGGRWDQSRKKWVIPAGKGLDPKLFAKWVFAGDLSLSSNYSYYHEDDADVRDVGLSYPTISSSSSSSSSTSYAAQPRLNQNTFYHRDHKQNGILALTSSSSSSSSSSSAAAAAASSSSATNNKAIPNERGRMDGVHGMQYVVYSDGSCLGNSNVKTTVNKAGFGIVVLIKSTEALSANTGSVGKEGLLSSSSSSAEKLTMLAQIQGPVVTDVRDTDYMGAEKGSNNTAELTAIGYAFKWFLSNTELLTSSSTIEIRFDSEYAAKSVMGVYNGKENRSLIDSIRKLYDNCGRRLGKGKQSIMFTHVKGHSGDYWNDIVDKLAKGGCDLEVASVVIKNDFRPSLGVLPTLNLNSNSKSIIQSSSSSSSSSVAATINSNSNSNSNSDSSSISNAKSHGNVFDENRLLTEENRRLNEENISLKRRLIELEYKLASSSSSSFSTILESNNSKNNKNNSKAVYDNIAGSSDGMDDNFDNFYNFDSSDGAHDGSINVKRKLSSISSFAVNKSDIKKFKDAGKEAKTDEEGARRRNDDGLALFKCHNNGKKEVEVIELCDSSSDSD